jgi:predicted negative regulator of RcsB-dependent stress response
MARMLLVLVLIVVVVAGLGFYLGWFHYSSASDDNNAHITMSVDKDQFRKDKDKAVDKAQDLGEKVEDKVETTVNKIQE